MVPNMSVSPQPNTCTAKLIFPSLPLLLSGGDGESCRLPDGRFIAVDERFDMMDDGKRVSCVCSAMNYYGEPPEISCKETDSGTY